MTEVAIDDADDLIRRLNELPNHFIFRGHADANWKLESSLERLLGSGWSPENARKFEDYSLQQFQSKFHLYDRENVQPKSKLAWLSLMQHYGVPTRLLDFTTSPYVALYFALESYDARQKPDLALYAFDYTGIMQRSIADIANKDSKFQETCESVYQKSDEVFDATVDRFSYDIAWISEPTEMNARIDRQAGSFLVSGNREKKITEIMDSPAYRDAILLRLVIHSRLYSSIFALLRKMNITSKSLYGDLNGLARAIKMELQIYSTQ